MALKLKKINKFNPLIGLNDDMIKGHNLKVIQNFSAKDFWDVHFTLTGLGFQTYPRYT
jgi:hypothetical protein